jgi:hypothetical protein
MTIGAVDVIKLLYLLRSEVDITSLLLLESCGFFLCLWLGCVSTSKILHESSD